MGQREKRGDFACPVDFPTQGRVGALTLHTGVRNHHMEQDGHKRYVYHLFRQFYVPCVFGKVTTNIVKKRNKHPKKTKFSKKFTEFFQKFSPKVVPSLIQSRP